MLNATLELFTFISRQPAEMLHKCMIRCFNLFNDIFRGREPIYGNDIKNIAVNLWFFEIRKADGAIFIDFKEKRLFDVCVSLTAFSVRTLDLDLAVFAIV